MSHGPWPWESSRFAAVRMAARAYVQDSFLIGSRAELAVSGWLCVGGKQNKYESFPLVPIESQPPSIGTWT